MHGAHEDLVFVQLNVRVIWWFDLFCTILHLEGVRLNSSQSGLQSEISPIQRFCFQRILIMRSRFLCLSCKHPVLKHCMFGNPSFRDACVFVSYRAIELRRLWSFVQLKVTAIAWFDGFALITEIGGCALVRRNWVFILDYYEPFLIFRAVSIRCALTTWACLWRVTHGCKLQFGYLFKISIRNVQGIRIYRFGRGICCQHSDDLLWPTEAGYWVLIWRE